MANDMFEKLKKEFNIIKNDNEFKQAFIINENISKNSPPAKDDVRLIIHLNLERLYSPNEVHPIWEEYIDFFQKYVEKKKIDLPDVIYQDGYIKILGLRFFRHLEEEQCAQSCMNYFNDCIAILTKEIDKEVNVKELEQLFSLANDFFHLLNQLIELKLYTFYEDETFRHTTCLD